MRIKTLKLQLAISLEGHLSRQDSVMDLYFPFIIKKNVVGRKTPSNVPHLLYLGNSIRGKKAIIISKKSRNKVKCLVLLKKKAI
jgi:hypothetical protein